MSFNSQCPCMSMATVAPIVVDAEQNMDVRPSGGMQQAGAMWRPEPTPDHIYLARRDGDTAAINNTLSAQRAAAWGQLLYKLLYTIPRARGTAVVYSL